MVLNCSVSRSFIFYFALWYCVMILFFVWFGVPFFSYLITISCSALKTPKMAWEKLFRNLTTSHTVACMSTNFHIYIYFCGIHYFCFFHFSRSFICEFVVQLVILFTTMIHSIYFPLGNILCTWKFVSDRYTERQFINN